MEGDLTCTVVLNGLPLYNTAQTDNADFLKLFAILFRIRVRQLNGTLMF